MIKYIVLIILVFGNINAFCQETSNKKPLIIGEIKTLNSKILNENRALNIYLPENFDSLKAYPVIYLLDGSINEDFMHICGLVQFFNMTFKMPDFIVVGIANVDRKRDFTFHSEMKDLKRDFPTTGHSAEFINFLEQELQPFINKNYKTTETKFLIGQSLGGLLASEILIKKPYLFTHYLIVSPSFWWDDGSLLNASKSVMKNKDYSKVYVYLSVGKKEEKLMIEQAETFYKILQLQKDIKIDFNEMANEDHATILHNAIYDAFLKVVAITITNY